MILTCWILLVVFGFLLLVFLRKLTFDSVNTKETLILVLSAFVTAIAAGIMYAGSLQAFIS